jgi:hypothetical protein
MRITELVRRALLDLGHASDEELAGYTLDAYGIRVHPRLVAAVRRSMKVKDNVHAAGRRRARTRGRAAVMSECT